MRKAVISREATHDLPQNVPPPQLPQFVADSSLEGDGLELPVPRGIGSVSTLGEE